MSEVELGLVDLDLGLGDAFTMGWIAKCIYGALSFFNFLYYSDAFYRKYTLTNFTTGAQWRTLNGNTEWTRNLFNVSLWGLFGLAWATTIFAGDSQFTYGIFEYLTLGMGICTITKFFLWILSFLVALIYDFGLYEKNEYLYKYYTALNGWGYLDYTGGFEGW